MKVCVLYSSYDLSNSPFKEHDSPIDILPHLVKHEVTVVGVNKATAVRQVRDLATLGFDVFLNLCDGAWDEDRAGIEVVQALERLKLPFTGAASEFYEPTREDMKMVCHYYGIPTPAYQFAKDKTSIEKAGLNLKFPLIVKHPNSYSSIGMTNTSKVMSLEALYNEADRFIQEFGEVLIEEFIEGREFTVLVAENTDSPTEPVVFQPVEFIFPEGETFKHYDIKWIKYDHMCCEPCNEPELDMQLRELSKQMFLGLNGSGYGRCDFRVNATGKSFLLEINPNCGIFYSPKEGSSADLILLYEPNGYENFLSLIFKSAKKRRLERFKKWSLRLDDQSHYGMYAETDIQPGDLIERFEERSHILVSREHVDKHWNALQKSWFKAYAYPISEDVWVMWGQWPQEWKPVNHSCDPNSWLVGLNLAARRTIKFGEQITMDYATFSHESMTSFQCHCGSDECRGMITGVSLNEPFMKNYENHISSYLKVKQKDLKH